MLELRGRHDQNIIEINGTELKVLLLKSNSPKGIHIAVFSNAIRSYRGLIDWSGVEWDTALKSSGFRSLYEVVKNNSFFEGL